MKFRSEVVDLVDGVLAEFDRFDLNLDAEKRQNSDSRYLQSHRHEYLRTVQDLLDHFGDRRNARIVEFGAFFGVVSICLSRAGFHVTAADVPEYMEMPEQIERFRKEGIEVASVRLQDLLLDFPSESFDALILCEVLEHLNFNPVPLLKEFNRILRDGGLFYLSLPNGAQINNRLRVLRGGAVGISPAAHFEQLRPGSSTIIYGHWREYTAPEVRELLQGVDFDILRQYYFSLGECQPVTSLRRFLARRVYEAFPSLKENQTTMAIRARRCDLPLRIPDTVHSGIDRL